MSNNKNIDYYEESGGPRPSEIGVLLAEKRKSLGLSQAALAQRSAVSSRTIFELEKGIKQQTKADVIVRLAAALEQNIEEWLKEAGFSTVADSLISKNIQKVTAKRGSSYSVSKRLSGLKVQNPQTFFESFLLGNKELPKLACVCYSSPPKALGNSRIIQIIGEMVKNGFWLAMFVPYIIDRNSQGIHARYNLFSFYEEVYQKTIQLAHNFVARIPDLKSRIRVFVPNVNAGNTLIPFVIPPSLMSYQIRPILIKPASDLYNEDDYRLNAWINIPPSNMDQVVEFSSLGLTNNNAVLLYYWREYFVDVLEPWLETNGEDWGTPKENSVWKATTDLL